METTPITNYNIASEIYNDICNCLGCNDKATEKIQVNVGKFRNISLFVCRTCLSKFTKK